MSQRIGDGKLCGEQDHDLYRTYVNRPQTPPDRHGLGRRNARPLAAFVPAEISSLW